VFGIFKRLRALEAQVQELETAIDLPELERMRGSVLNALRALRRSQTAQDEREATGKGSNGPDAIDRALEARRGHRELLRGR
jgi:hypothetical protein